MSNIKNKFQILSKLLCINITKTKIKFILLMITLINKQTKKFFFKSTCNIFKMTIAKSSHIGLTFFLFNKQTFFFLNYNTKKV